MATKIKMCGMTRQVDAQVAAGLGAEVVAQRGRGGEGAGIDQTSEGGGAEGGAGMGEEGAAGGKAESYAKIKFIGARRNAKIFAARHKRLICKIRN